ncbi:MAG: aminopeptidase P N-terminal domain-containing protein, partial [Gammaproteobacteria bacterium]|nr:aminopeptidase P N-terminal domain-containing protein [Gammaproteobacteria bacterium]
YLTGFVEPDAALLLRRADGEVDSLILCRDKDPLQETWHGRRLGVQAAPDTLQVKTAKPIGELQTVLDAWLDGAPYVYSAQAREDVSQCLQASAERLRGRARQGAQVPALYGDVDNLLNEMRLLKSDAEVALMRQSGDISARAHQSLMQSTRPDVMEYQLAAHFAYACSMEGSQRLAYGTIVAGGENACILHYEDNNQALRDGDLVLVDAGCELDYYAADITRTYPVNGRFSEPQKAIYNLVLEALEAAIAVVQEGVAVNAMQTAAVSVITQGLVDLGILQGDPDKLIADEAYKPFYLHNVGHWLGMDVHDVGKYKLHDQWRPLQAGMVTTIEPGIYIAPDTADIDPQWLGIGVRIEDNILVTTTGHENLTRQVPVTVTEIESLMQQSAKQGHG